MNSEKVVEKVEKIMKESPNPFLETKDMKKYWDGKHTELQTSLIAIIGGEEKGLCEYVYKCAIEAKNSKSKMDPVCYANLLWALIEESAFVLRLSRVVDEMAKKLQAYERKVIEKDDDGVDESSLRQDKLQAHLDGLIEQEKKKVKFE